MNRPYGAVDVAANLKGAVPKTATQKILVALAEKGELVMKTYGNKLGGSCRASRFTRIRKNDVLRREPEQAGLYVLR
jgi:hypothetical protein